MKRRCLMSWAWYILGIVLALIVQKTVAADAAPAADSTTTDDAFQARRELQTAYREVADKLRPSLVRIETVGGSQPRVARSGRRGEPEEGDESPDNRPRSQNQFQDDPGSRFVLADGPTTGIVFSSDGYIITSSFNFIREPSLISVTLPDGTRVAADLIARDQVRKLALLKAEADNLTVPEWVSPADIRIGQWAVALGLGFGGDEPSINVGIISAKNRMHGNAIQTDAKLSPANYGGPVCDLAGRVLGICVPLAQRPGELSGVEMYDSGIGFALTKDRVDDICMTLVGGTSFYRGWLGMTIDPRHPDAVVIGNIADPSPLREAGAQIGDRILMVEGREIRHFGELVQGLYMLPAGERIQLRLGRGDEELELTVKLARNTELGPLPETPEPLDPAQPIPPERDLEPAPMPDGDGDN